MLSPNRPAARLVPLCLGLLVAAGCEKVPLLAPTGSTITLTAATNALSANGSAQIIAQVIEAAGTPPHSGTHIIFTTTLGSIEPADATTDINGRAVVTYKAGSNNGNAVITASSGGATTGTNGALRIAVGSASVGRVLVSANPSTVSSQGGTTTITANVIDVNGNSLATTPVAFTTTAGSLSAAVAFTDANGNAAVSLTTSQTATVTATVGTQAPATPTSPTTPATPGTTTPATPATPVSSGTATNQVVVNVSASPVLVITPPASLNRGLPASFTFEVTAAGQNGSAVTSVVVDWGDGSPTQNLGPLVGKAIVTHTYNDDDSHTVSATVTDAFGNRNVFSTVVSVTLAPTPTVIVTPTPQSAPGGSTISFSIDIRAPNGVSIRNVVVDWGDGQTQSLGGASGVITVPHRYGVGVMTYTVIVTVEDSTSTRTTGTTTVSITGAS